MPQAVAAAVKGARYVFHVAADYRLWAPDPREIVRTNIDGTRVVMAAARWRRRRAHRLHLERCDAARWATTARPADETSPLAEA